MSFILASLDVSLRSRLFLFDTLPPYKQNGKKGRRLCMREKQNSVVGRWDAIKK